MPFMCSEYQKRFSWQLADDLPMCDVILLGGVPYTACCSLCGCIHELPIRSAKNGALVTPRCLLREYAAGQYAKGSTTAWALQYQSWLERFPDAAAHTAIRVQLVSINELMERPVLKVVKKKRSTASPRKVAA